MERRRSLFGCPSLPASQPQTLSLNAAGQLSEDVSTLDTIFDGFKDTFGIFLSRVTGISLCLQVYAEALKSCSLSLANLCAQEQPCLQRALCVCVSAHACL